MLICCAVLVLRVLVPSGFMIGAEQGRVTVTLCSGTMEIPSTVSVPMKRDGGTTDLGHSSQHAMPCPYGGLAFPALHVVDPIQLALLTAFILATGLVGIALQARDAPVYLRPPLRGPPARL